jgi:hypothetical protein
VDAHDRQRPGSERFNTLIGVIFLIIVLLSPGGLDGPVGAGPRPPQQGRREDASGTPGIAGLRAGLSARDRVRAREETYEDM